MTSFASKVRQRKALEEIEAKGSFLTSVRHEIFVDRKDSLMFLAHYGRPDMPLLRSSGFTGPGCSTNMSPLRGWERSLWVLGQNTYD